MHEHSFLKALSALLLLLTLVGCGKIGPGPALQGDARENAASLSRAESATSHVEPNSEAEALPPESSAEPATEPVTEPPTEPVTEPVTEPEPPAEPFVYKGLVELTAVDDSFIIDQRYATTNNFTGVIHYDRVLCLVNQDILPMLIQANNAAKAEGYRIKIWDAYRPISVQQALHDSAPAELSPYVPAPGPYSMHARGITVDVTLCDLEGNELDMPTGFDDFSQRAHSDYSGATEEQKANRELLNRFMSQAGFKRSSLEWWHFDGPNRDRYEILDVSFAEFEAARDS